MKLFRKQKSTLYKGFMAERNAELERERLLQKQREAEERRNRGKIRVHGSVMIGVSSLRHGCGCSYLAALCAVFLSSKQQCRICFITSKDMDAELSKFPIDVFHADTCDMEAIYREHYNFIIRDFGVYGSMRSVELDEYERSDLKFFVTWPDRESMCLLADFTQNVSKPASYTYFFNLVPEEDKSTLRYDMEDFETVIVPCTSLRKMDTELTNRFFDVFGKR